MSDTSGFNRVMGANAGSIQKVATLEAALRMARTENARIHAEYEKKMARATREITSLKTQAEEWAERTFGDAHRKEIACLTDSYEDKLKALRVKSRNDNTFNSAKAEAYREAIDKLDPGFFRPQSRYASGAQTTFLDKNGEVSVETLMGAWYHVKGRGKSIMLPPHVFDTLRIFGEVWNHYEGTSGDVAQKTSAERADAEKALREYGVGKTMTRRLLSSARGGTLENHGDDYIPQCEGKTVVTAS